MSIAIVTGSGGLVGAECARLFAERGLEVVGVDNDMRGYFFGDGASTRWQVDALRSGLKRYTHVNADIRDEAAMNQLFERYGRNISVIIHCAAQPSHDWAAREPATDFTVNANGTLTLLEATRKHAPGAVFIFVSTNKVYGDRPNHLPLVEQSTRMELSPEHAWAEFGIPEEMSIDATLHSLFGASKAAADLLVQEYGRYFGMRTACFRGGCLTGPGHSGAQLHGFLAYLLKCAMTDTPYTVFGYKGKQVRDNIHSRDLANAFWCVFQRPVSGEVFNIGGGRHSNCSMQEAVSMAEELAGRKMRLTYSDEARIGDHIWWISDVRKFRAMYPEWDYQYDIRELMQDIHLGLSERMAGAAA
ncbi:NAD-dependent epimerase/dehydratase family protein [Dankookia sp. P2]|uniref:NAD-dependent epimerase/dehydratase family protein n=1 Tax=Dankookia sp. P2 TaxID=3423955 RepID=UPI003D66D06D